MQLGKIIGTSTLYKYYEAFGLFASMAVGVPDKSKTSDKANGSILLLIYLVFLIYLAFFK